MRVLVTGATGFIGTALIARLRETGRFVVRAAVRREHCSLPANVEIVLGADLTPEASWQEALAGVDVVVHLAARVHLIRDSAADPLAEFMRVNTASTLNLARQAVEAGVRRFVFLSSVKVNGATGVFDEADVPAPQDPYGISKHEAEMGLREIAKGAAMDAVIIRPPLVYGPGVQANFRTLVRAVERGIPLPLGAVHNRRSLVALDNLLDFIILCVEHPAAGNETFFVSDGEDVATPDLIRRLADVMGRTAHLIWIPTGLLWVGARLLGKRDVAQRLIGSLQVNTSKARMLLGWVPPLAVDEGLRRAVAVR